jgi:radical SAM protein with 4Fe4S-binding SPASM domain
MLRKLIRRTTLLQRFVDHGRTVRDRRRHPEGRVPSRPQRIVVEPTNACNLSCAYCGNKDMARPRSTMDLVLFEALLEQMVALDISGVTLHTIGEPLLHPRIAEMVRRAKQHGRTVSLSTNGSLFTEQRTRALIDAGPDTINVSADAVDPEVLARTRAGLDADKLIEGMRRLHRLREERGQVSETDAGQMRMPSISLTCVITPHFTRTVERELFETLGPLVDDFHFQWPNNHADYMHDAGLLRRGWLPRRTRDALYQRVRGSCHYPWDTLFLLADGQMSVCRFDFDARVVIGRFPESSLEQLWHSERMASLRRAHMNFAFDGWEQCRSCSSMLYDNRYEHWLVSRKLMKRNGYRTRRDVWAAVGGPRP